MIGTGAKGVMWFNPMDHLYINGDENTDGSRRFNIDTETGLAIIEKRVEGIWQPTSIETGATSVWVGKNVAVAGLGHHLATEAKDGHLHFHAHSEFSAVTGLSVHDSQIVNAYYYEEHMAVVPDESGEWTGTIYNYNYASTDHRIFKKVYFKTGATPASEFVTFRVWEGTDDTGYLIFKQSYPISEFPANTEIPLVTEGYLEFSAGQNYYIRVESNATFSLKTTVDELYPYTYGDISLVHEDNMLQTIPYIDGENYGLNQWLIHDRRIYVCNTAGVQTGTFTDNIALWDIIGTGGGSTLWNANGGILENVAGPTALLFNDGTLDRFEISTNLAMMSADVDDYISVKNTEFKSVVGSQTRLLINNSGTYLNSPSPTLSQINVNNSGVTATAAYFRHNDRTRNRLEIDSGASEMWSPDGLSTVYLGNAQVQWDTPDAFFSQLTDSFTFNINSQDVIELTTTDSRMVSPDGTSKVIVANAGIDINDGTRDRVLVDSSETKLVSPDGSKSFAISNGGGAVASGPIVSEDHYYYIGDPVTNGTGRINMNGSEIEFWVRAAGVYNKVGGFS